jgi:hypothetical protein
MLKPLLIILSFLLCTESFAQKTITEYKGITDEAIRKYFSRSSFKRIKCDVYIAQQRHKKEALSGYFKADKNKKVEIESFAVIYYLYSKELNYKFTFVIDIDSNLQVNLAEYKGLEDIPECVKMNKPCNFIKQKDAIAIAQKDSIQYPDNLIAEVGKPLNSKDFYWIVSGQDKKNVDYSIKRKEGWQSYPLRKKNTRYVNAKTGKILSFEEYQRLNPDD